MFSCINKFVSASKKNMLEYEKNHLPMCNQFFVHGFKAATRSSVTFAHIIISAMSRSMFTMGETIKAGFIRIGKQIICFRMGLVEIFKHHVSVRFFAISQNCGFSVFQKITVDYISYTYL